MMKNHLNILLLEVIGMNMAVYLMEAMNGVKQRKNASNPGEKLVSNHLLKSLQLRSLQVYHITNLQ